MQCEQAGGFPSHLIYIDANRMTVSKVDYSSTIVVDKGGKNKIEKNIKKQNRNLRWHTFFFLHMSQALAILRRFASFSGPSSPSIWCWVRFGGGGLLLLLAGGWRCCWWSTAPAAGLATPWSLMLLLLPLPLPPPPKNWSGWWWRTWRITGGGGGVGVDGLTKFDMRENARESSLNQRRRRRNGS